MALFTPIDDNSTNFGDLISVELASTIADNINYLLDSMPLGTVLPIITSIPGIPYPDPNIWQICDGSTITNSYSPLRNNTVPILTGTGKYLKMFSSIGETGSYAGQNVYDLRHNHGGLTGVNDEYPTDGDTDDDFFTGKVHQHTIAYDLGTYDLDPVHITVSHFIKINHTGDAASARFKDLEKDFATTVAQSLWQKASMAINAFDKCYPIGTVMYFYATQSALPSLPDVGHWQILNGGTVTDPNSPIFGQSLPNFGGYLIKHPANGQLDLVTGGVNSINLTHSHGGATGVTNDNDDFQLDNGGEREEAGPHFHPISSDLSTYNLIPEYVQLQCYIRIT